MDLTRALALTHTHCIHTQTIIRCCFKMLSAQAETPDKSYYTVRVKFSFEYTPPNRYYNFIIICITPTYHNTTRLLYNIIKLYCKILIYDRFIHNIILIGV